MFHMHGHKGGHRGGPREGWEQFAADFAARWAMHGGGRGRHDHGERGPRGRRMFDGGELRLVLLKLIADEPRHGYDLIREIETLTGGAYAPSPGVVYPTLTLLDEMGLIGEQQSEGAKKRFAVTEAGTAHLAEHAEQAAALIARLTGLGSERTRPDQASIRRAMGNLHQAMRDRIARGGLDEDAMHDIAALIDELAQKIERLK